MALQCDARTTRGERCTRPPSFWLTDAGGPWEICAQHTYLVEKGRDLELWDNAHYIEGLKSYPVGEAPA